MSLDRLIVCVIVVFAPLLDGGTTHVAAMVIRLLVLIIAGLAFGKVIRAGILIVPRLPVEVPVIAFLALAACSAIGSAYPHQSQQWLMVLSTYAALLYLIVFFMDGWKDVVWLVGALAFVGVGESVYALFQFFVLGITRPSGTFFNPNFLAGYLAAIFPIVLGLGVFIRWSRYDDLKVRLHCRLFRTISDLGGGMGLVWFGTWMGGLILVAAAIFITGSRGGLLAAAASAACVLLARCRWRGFGVMVFAIVMVLAIPNPLRSRIEIEHKVNPESYARWQIWKQSIQAVQDNPLGYGLGLYQYVYPRYAFPIEGQIARYGKTAQTAHNEYLQIAVELGLLGLAIVCFGSFRILREARSMLRLRLRRWQRGLVMGAAGAIVGVLAQAAIDSNLHEPGIVIVLVVAAAIICSVRCLSTGSPGPCTTLLVRPRWVWAGCGVALLLIVGMAALKHGIAWSFFSSGSRALAERDIAGAIADYQVAVSLVPGKALYHSSLAAVQFKTFQETGHATAAQAAIDEMLEAISDNSLDGRLPGILGHVYREIAATPHPHIDARQQLEAKAVLAYERAKELEPFSPLHRFELARLYLDRGERQKAIAEAATALDLEPNCLIVREWLARTYLASGSPEDRALAKRQIQEILDRQTRYAGVPKNSLEATYMSVHSADLVAELSRAQFRES